MPHTSLPLAYSYLRFSSLAQAEGDSVRRQTDLRDGWLSRSKAVLDTSLNLRDEGKSAFTGEHRKNPDRHALAAFLRAVERGRVPKGSYLIVENLDRLSREHIQPALILFLNLLQAGVRVVQLLPVEQVFDEHSEAMQIMMAVMELSRGNSESRMKSERIGRAWAEKKRRAAADRTPLTKTVPAWLAVADGKTELRPDRAAVVQRIFKLVTEGHGLVAIARKLSTEQVPTFGRSAAWNPSTLHKVIHSRAAVGEYQPKKQKGRTTDGDPIPNYFPAAVSEEAWWAAQAALTSRHEGGRRTARHFNPFAGLLVDARDGGKLYVAGMSGRSRGKQTLVNYGATRGVPGTKFVSFPLDPFVVSVLTQLREVPLSEVLDRDANPAAPRVAELEAVVSGMESRRLAIQAELESGSGEVRAAVAVLRVLEERIDKANRDLADARARAATPMASAVADCQALIDVVRGGDNDEARARLKAALRRVVDRIVCLFVGRARSRFAAVQVWFKESSRHHDFLIWYTPGVGNAQKKRSAQFGTLQNVLPPEIASGLDLRTTTHVLQVEQLLTSLDLAGVSS